MNEKEITVAELIELSKSGREFIIADGKLKEIHREEDPAGGVE